jgi:MFS family permease
MCVAYFCFGINITGLEILMPLTLEVPKYGLMDGSVLESQERVAQTAGLLRIPQGLFNIIMMTLGYIVLSGRFGWSDGQCILVGGVTLSVAYACIGSTTELWQIFMCMAFNGAGVGLFLAAFVNLPSIYIAKFYSKSIGGTRAFTMTFMFVGMMSGSVLAASLFTNGSVELAWAVVACGPLIATAVIFTYTSPTIVSRIKQLDGGKPEWLEMNEKRQYYNKLTQGQKPKEWLGWLTKDLEAKLEERHYTIFNGHVQRAVAKAIDSALPELADFDFQETDKDGNITPGYTHLLNLSNFFAEQDMTDVIRMHEEYVRTEFNQEYDLHSQLDAEHQVKYAANEDAHRNRMLSLHI